jgi:hypothetical protein
MNHRVDPSSGGGWPRRLPGSFEAIVKLNPRRVSSTNQYAHIADVAELAALAARGITPKGMCETR